jgi:hypothetical protein
MEGRAQSLTSILQTVDPPHEIGWTGTTLGIKAVHVFRFEPRNGGTLARSRSPGRPHRETVQRLQPQTLDNGTRRVLAQLKNEAQRRAATA